MYNEHSITFVKSQAFAIRITKMVSYLQRNKRGMPSMLNQVLRSGSSVLANISEAQYAQSRPDFINKMHIALKEAHETQNWLMLLHASEALTDKEFESINNDCNEMLALLTSSINTAKKNLMLQK